MSGLGIGRKTPAADKFDLVSTCLHKIWHGVHTTSMGYFVKQGWFHNEAVPRYPTLKNSFDDFITFETTDGRNCPLVFIKDDPKKLATALAGGNLWFSTSEARIARLCAPKNFSSSPVSQLDFNFYGKENSLMKSHHDIGEAQHAHGPVVMRILNTIINRSATPAFECCGSVLPKAD